MKGKDCYLIYSGERGDGGGGVGNGWARQAWVSADDCGWAGMIYCGFSFVGL